VSAIGVAMRQKKFQGVIDNVCANADLARSAEGRGERVPPTRSPMFTINNLNSHTSPPLQQQPCLILRARSSAIRLNPRILQHPMRAPCPVLRSDELQARGRHQEAERHHFFGRPVQEGRRAEDQLHGHCHHVEMSRLPLTQFEHSGNEPMQQEHQETTGDEVGGYREKRRGIYYEI
jgi:hypothetical protein